MDDDEKLAKAKQLFDTSPEARKMLASALGVPALSTARIIPLKVDGDDIVSVVITSDGVFNSGEKMSKEAAIELIMKTRGWTYEITKSLLEKAGSDIEEADE